MPTTATAHHDRLTPEEARRALYIDVEGTANAMPSLLGTLRRGRGERPFVHWVALDPVLAGAHLRVLTFHDAITNLVLRAERNDRRIVAWSTHELDLVRTLRDEDPELVTAFEARFVNALSLAKRWRSRCHEGDKPARRRLRDYLELIGYQVPDYAPYDVAADAIRVVTTRLASGRELTPRHVDKWIRLLEHNRYDCAGTRAICLRAADEIFADEHPDEAPARPHQPTRA